MESGIKEITLVLADDHPLILKGLAEYLQEHGFSYVETATDGKLALEKIIGNKPDLAILDIDMPHFTGLEIARRAKELGIRTRFILLSYLKDPEFILQAKEVNIHGYVIKEDALQELIRSIQCVMRGERYFSQKLSTVDTTEAGAVRLSIKSLTPSELKILILIGKGMSSRAISEMLDVSHRTIEKHRSHIIAKLDIDGHSNALSQWLLENKSLLE